MSTDMECPVLLSHPMAEDTPAYGNGVGVRIRKTTSIAGGDTANTVEITLPNHIGTHVDVPAHFFDGGMTLTEYPAKSWLFHRPVLRDVQPGESGLIEPEGLEDLPHDTDLLILRTGHGRMRNEEVYWSGGPGLSPALGTWLRDARPSVAAVGMDLISVTSRLHREAGRAAHRAFLDPAGSGQPIRLIEDMDVENAPGDLARVLVSPFMLQSADGAPVTVWGFPGDAAS